MGTGRCAPSSLPINPCPPSATIYLLCKSNASSLMTLKYEKHFFLPLTLNHLLKKILTYLHILLLRVGKTK